MPLRQIEGMPDPRDPIPPAQENLPASPPASNEITFEDTLPSGKVIIVTIKPYVPDKEGTTGVD